MVVVEVAEEDWLKTKVLGEGLRLLTNIRF